MPYIPFPDEDRFSRYDHIIRVQGWNPPVAAAHVALYRAIMFGDSVLTRGEREALALVVSQSNGCHY